MSYRFPIPCAVGLVFVGAATLSAADWPGSKELVERAATAPDAALVSEILAASNAAFDRKGFSDAVGLRALARTVAFMDGRSLPEPLRRKMLAEREATESFAGLLSPADDANAVAKILAAIWAADQEGFAAYPKLAYAIALVYDKPCPRYFPHGQVSPEALPRRLPDPVAAFAFFKDSHKGGRLLQAPDKLDIDELAFVVPVLSPLAELREVQRKRITRADIPKLYPSIVYDKGRYTRREYNWPGKDYALESIRKNGGICVDQAYYTATIAQAFGVPAFILSGAGADGFHAFVGFMERPGKWKTDVGRYENQKYVTGSAWNPMTWRHLTDHDLSYLQERFRGTPAYASALLHVERADEALAAGDLVNAAKWYTAAKAMQPKCPEAWEGLYRLAVKRGDPEERRRTLYAEAAANFTRYRELEVLWRGRLADSWATSGKLDASLDERAAIVRRTVRARPDLALEIAVELMKSAAGAGDTAVEMKAFSRLAGQFDEAGTIFVPTIGAPFVMKLLTDGKKKEAVQAARALERAFKADKTSQLGEMLAELSRRAASGEAGGGKLLR